MKLINCDVYEFIDIIKNKCLVCFGVGVWFDRFIDRYESLSIENYLCYISDNDLKKVGKNKKVINKEIPIISPEQLKNLKNVAILITCADVFNVFDQLNVFPELSDVWCFASSYIMSETTIVDERNRYYPATFRITPQQIIPKKIHYCWFGGKPIPEKNLYWMESWKKYCPDYEIIRWDESNYDVSKNKYMYDAYKAKKWGFVPDYARLDIIYQHGGIYLDTDVELIANMDELLFQQAFVGIDSPWLINLGSGFGAVSGHKIIGELRDMYCHMEFCNRDGRLNMTPCPILQKDYFKSKGYVNNGNYQIIDEVSIYPEKILSAKCSFTDRILPTERSVAIHHFDGSWVSPEQKRIHEERFKLFQSINE